MEKDKKPNHSQQDFASHLGSSAFDESGGRSMSPPPLQLVSEVSETNSAPIQMTGFFECRVKEYIEKNLDDLTETESQEILELVREISSVEDASEKEELYSDLFMLVLMPLGDALPREEEISDSENPESLDVEGDNHIKGGNLNSSFDSIFGDLKYEKTKRKDCKNETIGDFGGLRNFKPTLRGAIDEGGLDQSLNRSPFINNANHILGGYHQKATPRPKTKHSNKSARIDSSEDELDRLLKGPSTRRR